MWECPVCDVWNSDGMEFCRCGQVNPSGQPKSPQKPRSGVKVKTAADVTRKLRKPRKKGTGGAKRYCVVCGVRVYTDDCIWRQNTEYFHHGCFQEMIYG